MTTLSIGVFKETATGERRVAAVPETIARLGASGAEVLVERGAGLGARVPDGTFADAGASLVEAAELDARADLLLCVRPPTPSRIAGLRAGQVLVGLLDSVADTALIDACARSGLTVVDLTLLPRTLSRAQAMDALTSQANIAGYRAALLAAATYERFFPLLMTAAGTGQPARVLVLGAGVAGLSAIGTARRLGAVVTGYDIRPEARDEVHSMGARFLNLGEPVAGGAASGGYARALTESERDAQQAALQERIRDFDVVIATAQVPGRRPPVLVTRDALKAMRPGSVVVDLAAGPHGGNVEGSEPDRTAVLEDGITVIGAGNLASSMAAAASAAYARNIAALVSVLVRDGALVVDLDDEIQNAVVVAHRGAVRHPAARTPAPGGPDER
jgi:proton-translocating NAD(P)+ transhydrogenase subunit alpha